MTNDVLVAEHTPPIINGAIYHQMKVSMLLKHFGYRINPCGYCGEPLMTYKSCRCGYTVSSNDKGELIWTNQPRKGKDIAL